jgi:hypothetical protein
VMFATLMAFATHCQERSCEIFRPHHRGAVKITNFVAELRRTPNGPGSLRRGNQGHGRSRPDPRQV